MKKILIVSTMALMVSGVAAAQDEDGKKKRMQRGSMSGMHQQMMKGVDANKDGVITRAEVAAAKKARFDKLDANGDGSISQDEMQARHEAMMAEHKAKMAERKAKESAEKKGRMGKAFSKMDKDSSGGITLDEFGRGGEEDMFSRMDSDGDGSITKEERKAAAQKMHKRMKKMHHRKKDGRNKDKKS